MLFAISSRVIHHSARIRGSLLPSHGGRHLLGVSSSARFSSHNGGGGQEKSAKDATRVFVSGLPDEANWKDLKDHFKICGLVY